MSVHRRLLLGAGGGGSFVIPLTTHREALYNGSIDGGVTYAIGAARFDGSTWTKDSGNPVLTKGAGGTWDADGVKDPSLVWDGTTYHCYYAGYKYTAGDPAFRIGHATATSLSGPWTKDAGNPVVTTGGGDTTDLQAPNVFYDASAIGGHAWWMWYAGDGTNHRLAHSDDGITWTKDGTVTMSGPVWYLSGTFYMMGTDTGLVLYTFTTPTGTYTADAGNPLLQSRSHATHISNVLTANASAAATSITVGSGTLSDLQVGEPLFIVDSNSGPEVKRVSSVAATTIGVAALTNSYQTADGATARSFAYTIIDARSLIRMGDGTWEAFGTAFRPGDGLTFSGNALWEGSLRYTAPAVTGPWAFDWDTGLIFALTSLGAAWDSVSAENLSVIPAAGGTSGGGTVDTGGTDFLSRPSHGVYSVSGGTSVLIENVSIVGGTRDAPSGIGITIANVTGSIIIRNVDLAHLVGGIYITNCSGTLEISGVRSLNIGDGTIGSGHSNHIQLATCVFPDGSIHDNQFRAGRTEDMLSIYQTGGTSGHELVIEDNHFQGLVTTDATARAWSGGSGTGTIIGDDPGHPNNGYTIVRNNTYLTPGQVGIQILDGPGIRVNNNTIYGEQRPDNNNPLTSFAGNPVAEVDHNTYYWTNNDGSHPTPFFGAGTINSHDNTQDAGIDHAALEIVF